MMILRNGDSASVAQLQHSDGARFHATVLEQCAHGGRLGALFYLRQARLLVAVVLQDEDGTMQLVATQVEPEGTWPSLTMRLPEAQALERAVWEEHGITPEGHPWLKPLRRHSGLDPKAPPHPFFRVEGEGVHEVAVGPVHAGIIEPGHFRFQCSGELVHSLEIHLGYQHRGVLPILRDCGMPRRLAVAESIAGDTVLGHGLAHVHALEALMGIEPPLAAQVMRGVALELERLANHVGDLGALCNDVGYQPGASWFGRLRGEFLNVLMKLTGNRFGRGLVVPGGVRFGPDEAVRGAIREQLSRAERDLRETMAVMLDTASVLSRFEQTGTLTGEQGRALGLVGPAARACGLARDVRHTHPTGIYRFAHIPMAVMDSGDVMARALERWLEVERSLTFVRERLQEDLSGPLRNPSTPLHPSELAVSLVEGWRGECVHVIATNERGEIADVDVVDPSLHNWFGLAMALRGNEISDFPLCNKSFNLSYAGYDL